MVPELQLRDIPGETIKTNILNYLSLPYLLSLCVVSKEMHVYAQDLINAKYLKKVNGIYRPSLAKIYTSFHDLLKAEVDQDAVYADDEINPNRNLVSFMRQRVVNCLEQGHEGEDPSCKDFPRKYLLKRVLV